MMPRWPQILGIVLYGLIALAPPVHAGWRLTFSDEFDGAVLDSTKWKLSDLWSNQTLSNNGEKQCYVPGAVRLVDGFLRLEATESVTLASACKSAKWDLQFKSGMVTTAGCNIYEKGEACARLKAFSQSYGYFEMRARLPKGKGLWPAFWLVPIDGSWPPEIDIMEHLGSSPSTIHHTYHYLDATRNRQRAGGVNSSRDFSSSFTTFGVDWRPGLIVWYVDGVESFRYSGTDVAEKRMYLLLNLAVGGGWPGDPDATTVLPAVMEVDYVRVYERVDDGRPDDSPPPPMGDRRASPSRGR